MKFNKKVFSIILAVLTVILFIGGAFFGGMNTERYLDENSINYNTYCENGTIVQKIEDQYLLHLDNGKYSLVEATHTFADNTKVIVCYERNETDKTDDDRIIAISTDLHALAESLFAEVETE